MTRVLRQLWNNLSSVVLSLLLAVAVWVTATLQADPFDVREYVGVPVGAINQPENTILFEGDAARVTVEARAPQSVLLDLSVSNFEARMDLADVEPGVTTLVPISVTCDIEAVRIVSYDPQQEPVRLEELSTITLPVEITVEGEVATGYLSTRPVVTPREVAIQGPVPFLDEIVTVTGSVDVEGAKEDIVELVTVVPRDAEGGLVPGVQWAPEQVEVRIGVRRRVGYKPEVEVVPDVRGDPVPGYRRGSVSVEPSAVTLAGPSSVLNELPGFVRTEPITITDETESLTTRTSLDIPPNVIAVGVNFVTVTVDILPVLSSRTMTSTVEIQGLREGWVAYLSPSVVDVVLEGPDTVLSELTSDDIEVFVNLFNFTLGVQRVEPVVLAPEEVTVVSVIPETIEVVIALPPTPTLPPPTATITATVPITATVEISSP
ncbi:MAG: CdaR family protein [Anaerolineae bacterium]|jgi:YbbR domain-containing protein